LLNKNVVLGYKFIYIHIYYIDHYTEYAITTVMELGK